MRVAALLVLAFASLFSLWAITGMHIMRCALTITLIESVEMEDDAELEQWLLREAKLARSTVNNASCIDRHPDKATELASF